MDGAIVQVAPDRVVVRASALGGCTKALVAARMGYDAIAAREDDEAVVRMREGHLHEQDVLTRMGNEGWSFVPGSPQKEVVVAVTDRLFVVGHLDAEAMDPNTVTPVGGTTRIVEIKSQSKEQWRDFEARGWDSGFFPQYKWQLSCYMHAENLPAVVVRKNRDNGQLAYEYVDQPFYSLTEIRVRVMMIEAAYRKGELPGPCDNRKYPCPYFYLHEDEPVQMLEDDQLDVLARMHEDAKAEEKAAKQRKEDARKALRGALVGIDKCVTSAGTKISFYEQKNPPRLNENKMREDGIDVDSYKEQGSSERLRITLPKEVVGDG